ncbi:hypothetical protein ES705_39741 [subsurface metagenome]
MPKQKIDKKGPVPILKGGFDLSNQGYEKPLFEKTEGMNFTAEIWKKFRGACGCMQCSACHGCA